MSPPSAFCVAHFLFAIHDCRRRSSRGRNRKASCQRADCSGCSGGERRRRTRADRCWRVRIAAAVCLFRRRSRARARDGLGHNRRASDANEGERGSARSSQRLLAARASIRPPLPPRSSSQRALESPNESVFSPLHPQISASFCQVTARIGAITFDRSPPPNARARSIRLRVKACKTMRCARARVYVCKLCFGRRCVRAIALVFVFTRLDCCYLRLISPPHVAGGKIFLLFLSSTLKKSDHKPRIGGVRRKAATAVASDDA